jgi:hypothetical protein
MPSNSRAPPLLRTASFSSIYAFAEVIHMKRWLVLGIAVLTAAGGAGAAARNVPAAADHGGPRYGGYRGYFAIGCAFSHRNNDDPIVYPGRPGLSHNHTFLGNRTTNASSTRNTLRGQATSCRLAADTAAYWVPTLFVNSRAVNPLGATVFYIRRTAGPVRAFPAGLKVIAGDAMATRAQGARVTYWTCGRLAATSLASCPAGFRAERVRLVVKFPNCWNGTSLDSANHKSHLAYSVDGACPASHPVAVPALAIAMHYPALGAGPIALSSGGQFSGHADFVNAWDQDTLERLVARYLNRGLR